MFSSWICLVHSSIVRDWSGRLIVIRMLHCRLWMNVVNFLCRHSFRDGCLTLDQLSATRSCLSDIKRSCTCEHPVLSETSLDDIWRVDLLSMSLVLTLHCEEIENFVEVVKRRIVNNFHYLSRHVRINDNHLLSLIFYLTSSSGIFAFKGNRLTFARLLIRASISGSS